MKNAVVFDLLKAQALVEACMEDGDASRPWFVDNWGVSPAYEGSIENYSEMGEYSDLPAILLAVDAETHDAFCLYRDGGTYLVYNGDFANCEYYPDDLPNKIAKFKEYSNEAEACAAWVALINASVKG